MLTAGSDEVALYPHPPTAAKLLQIPGKAWDCHAHVNGDPAAYPFIAERVYTPVPCSVEEYLDVLDTARIEFGVLVQISVHGYDTGTWRRRDDPSTS